MVARRILPVFFTIVIVALLSGCICCCGMDSSASKLKKSVGEISFPAKLDIGGKSYFKQNTFEGLTPNSSQADAYSLSGGLGYSPSAYGDAAPTLWSFAGISQYKSFIYAGKDDDERIHGAIAKTGAPSTASLGYMAVKQMAMSGLARADDPRYNVGEAKNIVYDGAVDVGDGGDRLSATVKGHKCYVVVCRYSNIYVAACSLENYSIAEQAVRMAIDTINLYG